MSRKTHVPFWYGASATFFYAGSCSVFFGGGAVSGHESCSTDKRTGEEIEHDRDSIDTAFIVAAVCFAASYGCYRFGKYWYGRSEGGDAEPTSSDAKEPSDPETSSKKSKAPSTGDPESPLEEEPPKSALSRLIAHRGGYSSIE